MALKSVEFAEYLASSTTASIGHKLLLSGSVEVQTGCVRTELQNILYARERQGDGAWSVEVDPDAIAENPRALCQLMLGVSDALPRNKKMPARDSADFQKLRMHILQRLRQLKRRQKQYGKSFTEDHIVQKIRGECGEEVLRSLILHIENVLPTSNIVQLPSNPGCMSINDYYTLEIRERNIHLSDKEKREEEYDGSLLVRKNASSGSLYLFDSTLSTEAVTEKITKHRPVFYRMQKVAKSIGLQAHLVFVLFTPQNTRIIDLSDADERQRIFSRHHVFPKAKNAFVLALPGIADIGQLANDLMETITEEQIMELLEA